MIAIIDYVAGNIKSITKVGTGCCDHTKERADFSCG